VDDKRAPGTPPRRLVDYYRFLGVARDATTDQIVEAYLRKAEDPDPRVQERAERAIAVLSDPATRASYDQDLAASRAANAGSLQPQDLPARSPGRRQPGTDAQTGVKVRPAGAPARRSSVTAQSARRTRPQTSPPPTVIDLNWRWALAAIPVLLIIGALLLGSGPRSGGNNAAGNASTLAGAVTAPVVNGVQTLDVLLNGNTFQYEPKTIKVKKGLPVHFNLSIKGDPG